MELSSGETILLVLCLLSVAYEAVVVILIKILINRRNKAKAGYFCRLCGRLRENTFNNNLN